MLQLLSVASAAKKYILPLVLLLLVGVQTFRLDRAQTALLIEESAHRSTKAALDAQAVGVAAVESKSKELLAASERAAKAVQKVAVAAEARARALESAPTPATCQAAIEFLARDAAGAAE